MEGHHTIKSGYYKIFENYQIILKVGKQTFTDPLDKPCEFQVDWTSSFCVVAL